jgi:hypothetical protein
MESLGVDHISKLVGVTAKAINEKTNGNNNNS